MVPTTTTTTTTEFYQLLSLNPKATHRQYQSTV